MTPSSSFSDPAVALELGKRLANNTRRRPAPPRQRAGLWTRLFTRRSRVELAAGGN